MRDGITDFIKKNVNDTDIFCFQEASDDMDLLCKDILAGYDKISSYKFVTKDDVFSQVIYIRKGVNVLASGTLLSRDKNIGLGVYIQCIAGKRTVSICNYHGMSRPVEKLDDPGRLKASQELINYFQSSEGLVIIGGDFNLFPDSVSIQMFEKNNYRDLIKDYNIKTTRNRLAWERYPDNKQYYSDYVFVNKGTNIKEFTVPICEISDHLPLILEVEL